MTEPAAAETAAQTTDNPPSTTDAPAADANLATKPTETVEFWKEKAREQEKRAKANADAAARLAEIEEAQKTEAQKLAEARDAALSEAQAAKAEAMRLRIATKFGISEDDADTFLTGSDEETLTKQAERLSKLAQPAEDKGVPGPRPDLSQGARDTPASGGDPASDFADFLGGQLKS